MNRGKDLAKNTVIIAIGAMCTKLIAFLLLPLYTSILSTSEYGVVDLLNTLVSLIAPVVTLQIEQGVFRYLISARGNDKSRDRVISTAYFFTFAISIAYLALFFIISPFINNDYKYFLAFNVVASAIMSLLLQTARGLGSNAKYSAAGVIAAVATIIFNILFMVFIRLQATGMLLGTLIGYIFGCLYLFFSLGIAKSLSISYFNKQSLRKLMKYSLPMLPNSLSWWVFDVSDRVIVSLLLGLSATGILSVSYKFSGAFILVYNIFDKSWCESIIMHIKDKDIEGYFNRMFDSIFKIFLGLGIALIAVIPFVFHILINKNFDEAYYLMPIAVVSVIFQVIVGLVSGVYAANDNTKSLARTAIWSAAVNIGVHLALINLIGIYAAVVSTLVSKVIFSIYRATDVSKKYIRIRPNYMVYGISMAVLAFVLLCYYSNNYLLYGLSLVAALVLLVAINYKTATQFMRAVMKKVNKKRGELHG